MTQEEIKRSKADLLKELQKIYDSEINFSIECFWDGGFIIRLGDELNGVVTEDTFYDLGEGVLWLIKQVVKYYPNSLYAKKR